MVFPKLRRREVVVQNHRGAHISVANVRCAFDLVIPGLKFFSLHEIVELLRPIVL